MARPDLSEPIQREAYRRELRGLYRPVRMIGLAMVVIAGGLLLWPRMGGPWMLGPLPMQYCGWALLALGWTLLIGVIIRRTRYHRRRMAEPPA